MRHQLVGGNDGEKDGKGGWRGRACEVGVVGESAIRRLMGEAVEVGGEGG